MDWILAAFAFATSLFGIGNALVAVIHHVPFARTLARTHEVAKAQRADGKLDVWYGPVPYARILVGPIMGVGVFVLFAIILWLTRPSAMRLCGIAAIAGVTLGACGLYDPNERFKRDLLLLVGDNWMSKQLTGSVGNLCDEQQLRDLPTEVYRARSYLLSSDAEHKDREEFKKAMEVVFRYDRPRMESEESLLGGRMHVQRYALPKALLDYSIYKSQGGDVSHHFSSSFGLLRNEKEPNQTAQPTPGS